MNPSRTTVRSSGGALPDFRAFMLNEGIVPEQSPGGGLALWLPGERERGLRHWERISVGPRSAYSAAAGVSAAPAGAIVALQMLGGPLQRLWRRLRGAASGTTWLLPDGTAVEQRGDRRTDLLLAWAEESASLDEAGARSLWPECRLVRQLGGKLFLVEGVQLSAGGAESPAAAAGPDRPRQLALQLLAEARSAGNARKEAVACTDLGVIELQESHADRATEFLEQARAAAKAVGDPDLECDVLVNLGLALVHTSQPRRALPVLDEALRMARQRGDRFAEKLALERLAVAHIQLSDPIRALTYFEPALALAAATGDRKHQADLLWQAAVLRDQLGQVDWSLTHAQASVELLDEMQDPRAAVFADQLRRYRADVSSPIAVNEPAKGTAHTAPLWDGSLVVSAGSAAPATGLTRAKDARPSLPKMAISAGLSAYRFARGGFGTVSATDLASRLSICATCEQHTGLRCRVCGCFTNMKARLPHEKCPAGKW
jgi:tetratricopeptide (TPR) repeat protein